jgi:hypothetical protein
MDPALPPEFAGRGESPSKDDVPIDTGSTPSFGLSGEHSYPKRPTPVIVVTYRTTSLENKCIRITPNLTGGGGDCAHITDDVLPETIRILVKNAGRSATVTLHNEPLGQPLFSPTRLAELPLQIEGAINTSTPFKCVRVNIELIRHFTMIVLAFGDKELGNNSLDTPASTMTDSATCSVNLLATSGLSFDGMVKEMGKEILIRWKGSTDSAAAFGAP